MFITQGRKKPRPQKSCLQGIVLSLNKLTYDVDIVKFPSKPHTI